MQISETETNVDYKNYRQLSKFRHISENLCQFQVSFLLYHHHRKILSKTFLSTLKGTFHDHDQLLSNFKDTFHLVHSFDMYYVSNSIKVRFKNKNIFGICKSSKQKKVRNTPPIISSCLK